MTARRLLSLSTALLMATVCVLTAALLSAGTRTPGETPPDRGSATGASAPAATGPLTAAEHARQRLLARLVDRAPGAVPSAEVLADHGFVRVSTGPRFVLASSSDDVSFPTPYVYFDTTYHRYTAVAKYTWDCQCWENQGGGNVGGADGFALRFDRRMDNRGVTGTFHGRAGLAYGATVVRNPADNSSAGVAYSLQDQAVALCCGKGSDYNMHHGTVTMDVGRPACGTTTHLYSRYFHTWSDSAVTGFSVSVSGFGVSWNSSSKHWSAASQAGTWTIRC